ncbi:P-loop containing nucleoside triphosphate hydrolase protein [Suillus fuscotomentosus]|uniref:P-loop containing nucleoside triphosphate hydrolase protein n=1 Tax=Suillus fuscotomentosus TaxID=1912939 RepID=A0AAD4EFI8_9AGAM|nr:P-loop containing nucleoside triphosphate hydrolase protein [Suillus fuscotomentosus]KAG1905166.1 P-loop containing nucleoside triphosphate hydrolase protein [Suillus fuscotomentosus]
MSKKIQSGVVCALLAGRHLIFQNEDIIQDIYGLGPQLFNGPGPHRHLNENQLKSLREMMSAVEKAKDIKTRYNILEGKQQTSYGAGRDALTIWFKKQQISSTISTKVDAIWKELDLLPLQLIHLDPDAGFPNVADADMAREDIAVALFGANSVSRGLRGEFRESLSPIVHHNWERHRKMCRRAEKTLGLRRMAAIVACKLIEDAGTVTPQMLREATHHGVSELEEFLKTVVVTAVAKAKGVAKEKLAPEISDPKEPSGSAKSRGRTRASKVKNVSLSAAGDVDLIWPAYVQLYRTAPTEPDAPAVDLDGEDRDAMWEGSNDLGVDNFRSLDDTALNRLLNFPDGRPALFARFRSLSRKSAWDDGAEKEFVDGNPDMQPLSLLWHQRVGIASIVEKIWQKDQTNAVPGILLADEVGVGKTAQVMGSIAFMIDQYWAHEIRQRKGRIASESIPYFAGQAQVPNLPHVIAVPNSLVAQWMSELRIFFAPKTVEIYVYPTAEKDFAAFWTGPWEKSSMPKINRIILVTHSVFTTQGKVLDTRKGKVGHNQNKAVDDKRTVKSPHLERNCIWYMRVFASCTLDEAHEFRNPNAGWHAMLLLMRNSHVRIIATATPLFTSPKDLCNIGRVLRIPHFTGTEGDDFENNHWKALGAARRVITKEDKELAAKHTIQRLAGSKAEYNEPASKTRVRQLTTVWIKQIKRGFSNRVIRRTVESLRFDGKRINDSLPPYLMVFFPVHLTDPELDIVETGMDSLAGKDVDSMGQSFYMEARTKVPLPFHNSPNYPPVADWDEYNEVRSTKVDYLMTLLRWHLISDDNGVYKDLDKELTEEEQKKLDDEYDKDTDPDFIGDYAIDKELPELMSMGTKKILVYTEFTMMAPLLLSILKMHDIEALSLNGTLTADERNETIRRFNTVPEDRVLLFSTVGAVGLNLTVATIVVLFDQCWSRMLVNQIIGRAWRLGQEDTVTVYNMVAVGTVDVLMVDHGEGKGKMLGQFLSRNKAVANTIQKAVKGDEIPDNDIDDDVEESDDDIEVLDGPPAGSTFRSRASGSSRKSTSAASTVPDKTATRNKIIRTYGGKKQQARNLKTTGDDEGKIFDRSSVVVDDDGSQPEADEQDDGADATSSTGPRKDQGKQKAMGKAMAKGKEKVKVVEEDIDMDDEEEGTSEPPRPKAKPKPKAKVGKPKAKGKDKAVEDDIEMDEEEEGTSEPPRPKPKPRPKAKGKDKAVEDDIDMDDDEEGTSAPPPPKQKPRPKPTVKGTEKGKSTALMSATERIMQDEQITSSRGAKPGPANRAAAAVPSSDEDDDSQIQPRSSGTAAISSTAQRDETDVEDDEAGARINLTRRPVIRDVDDGFTLDDGDTTGPLAGTQNSAKDKSDVEALLGEKQMSDLTLTERDDDRVQSSQPWDDQRFTDTYSGGQKRRRSTTSTVASPPSGPQRSPNRPRPPHKKVHVHGDGSAAVRPSQSSQNEGAGGSISFNDRTAVPENAPKPRGMRGLRGRGGISRARS